MPSPPPPSADPYVIFMPSGRRRHVASGTTLLEAARLMGVEIESICGGRLTCGKCKVRIEEGAFSKHGIVSSQQHLSAPTAAEEAWLRQADDENMRLACNARVWGDVLAFVPAESRAQKQIIRKSAGERAIEVAPTVRQVYVEVDAAQLGEHRGDWGRLQDALAEQWRLQELEIDLPALQKLQSTLRQQDWAVTVTVYNENEVIDVQPGYAEGAYGLAVDIGSTTVAAYLCDLRTGELLATAAAMNPQVAYGEDLMSRISYAVAHRDGLQKMHDAVIDTINRLGAQAARQAKIRRRQIVDAVFVGNTTMIHILLGINPVELGEAPFALARREGMDLRARDLNLHFHPGAHVTILPAEAGHVGADNVGVLIAEAPYQQDDEVVLIVDVGTNAEILLGNKNWMYSASSPTGPAFEGAQIQFGMRAAPGAIERVRIDAVTKIPRFRVIGEERWCDAWHDAPPRHLAAGICGSGIIEVIAELYLQGLLLPDGRFNSAIASERLVWEGARGAYILATPKQSASGEAILVSHEDVRAIQLAKAALYAGAKLLMKRAGITRIDRITLAGAFGSYIDPQHAMVLGLIPDCELDKVHAVGNAAGDGARIALLNRHKRREAEQVALWVHYIETAVEPEFQDEFVRAIHIPHQRDAFPHLQDILPVAGQHPVPPARARRRRAAGGRRQS